MSVVAHGVDRRVADHGAGVGRVDHHPAADVDADVGEIAVEEHQVTGLKGGKGDVRRLGVLGAGVVGQSDSRRGPGVHGEPGAVEAPGAGGAALVGLAQLRLGGCTAMPAREEGGGAGAGGGPGDGRGAGGRAGAGGAAPGAARGSRGLAEATRATTRWGRAATCWARAARSAWTWAASWACCWAWAWATRAASSPLTWDSRACSPATAPCAACWAWATVRGRGPGVATGRLELRPSGSPAWPGGSGPSRARPARCRRPDPRRSARPWPGPCPGRRRA